jgi:thioredoxin 2
MAPGFERAAQTLRTSATLAKLNTEEAPAVAAHYGIRSIPTLIAFRGGQEIARQAGAMGSHDIVRWIQQLRA